MGKKTPDLMRADTKSRRTGSVKVRNIDLRGSTDTKRMSQQDRKKLHGRSRGEHAESRTGHGALLVKGATKHRIPGTVSVGAEIASQSPFRLRSLVFATWIVSVSDDEESVESQS